MTQKELDAILKEHKRWTESCCTQGARAIFDGQCLKNLSLRGANLVLACFYDTDLSGADLTDTNLDRAYFRNVKMIEADLVNAFCAYVCFDNVDFTYASVVKSDLSRSIFSHCDFTDADFYDAILHDVTFCDIKNPPKYLEDITRVCPKEGVSFIGWKRCGEYIVKLMIPGDAKRSNGVSRKCRCSKAKVLSIEDEDGHICNMISVQNGIFNVNVKRTIYTVGEMVYADSFDNDRWNECSHGIHFFMTREEAVNYMSLKLKGATNGK